MYTEIKEVVNYLASSIFGKLPRRKVITFSEQLANALLRRYKDTWNAHDPTYDDHRRIIPIRVRIQTPSGTYKLAVDNDIVSSAKQVGIDAEELISFLNIGCTIHVNPGEVLYTLADNTTHLVWSGRPDADDQYSPLPECVIRAAEENACGDSTGHSSAPQPDSHIVLKIEKIPVENDVLRSEFQFVAISRDLAEYTVEQFSVTRFGSHRARPDHEVMKRIQRQAAFEALSKTPNGVNESGDECLVSGSNSPLSSSSSRASPSHANNVDIIRSMSPEQVAFVKGLLLQARNGSGSNLDSVMAAFGQCSLSSPFPSVTPLLSSNHSFHSPYTSSLPYPSHYGHSPSFH